MWRHGNIFVKLNRICRIHQDALHCTVGVRTSSMISSCATYRTVDFSMNQNQNDQHKVNSADKIIW
jgi:hypothetical protein